MKVLRLTLLAGMFSMSSHAANFTIASNDVAADKPVASEFIFNGFGCTGGNLSPELHWSGVPADAKSLALSIYDPDAPTGSGWWHWYVVNLPVTTKSLPRGAGTADGAKLPAGAQQISTDFGSTGYGGPCPPQGDKPHRYIVTLYALKVPKLELPKSATPALAGFMVKANAIGSATFTFNYSR